MIIQAHPMGNAFVRELASGLAEEGLLQEFWTALDYPSSERWLQWLPEHWRQEARRRQLPAGVKPFAHLFPWRELARLAAPRIGLGGWSRHEVGCCSVDRVMHDLDTKVARRLSTRPTPRGVYLYEDGAAATFAAARERGLATFYDLPIGYWRAARRILREEADLSPEWAMTMRGNTDSETKLARKDRELSLADTVFVASSFTRRTLADFPGAIRDVVVVPYGAPSPKLDAVPAVRGSNEPLKVLFVGSLGQRKGLRYLLDAFERLGGALGYTLSMIGTISDSACKPLTRAVQTHRHVSSLPHDQILAEMRRHHVLVLPSLFEGFGLVLSEAMASGLPIIATPHTAAPDILDDGVEGYVVPIRSAESIAAKLVRLRDDETARQAMGAAAMLRAARMPWSRYRRLMVEALKTRLGSGCSG